MKCFMKKIDVGNGIEVRYESFEKDKVRWAKGLSKKKEAELYAILNTFLDKYPQKN